jgi:hypothetical protein
MNTVTAAVWIIALYLPNGGVVQMPGQFTQHEECLAALSRVGPVQAGATARCVQSGTVTVPLPADVVQKLREHEDAQKAKAAKK